MSSIAPKPEKGKRRLFQGFPATVAFETDADSGVVWCALCREFHRYTGMAARDISTACPKTPDGERTLILFCGSAPIAIRRAAWLGKLDREARRALDSMLGVLDALISSEEIPS